MDAANQNSSVELDQFSPQDNPQDQLIAAVRTKNHVRFQLALKNGGNPNEPYPESNKNYSVFEFCCSQPGMAVFIEGCLRWGCDVNQVNKHRPTIPIILVSLRAMDPKNLAALLTDPTVQLDYIFEGTTALFNFISDINATNFDDRFEAIQLLIGHNANINITDHRGVSPILFLLMEYQLDNALKRQVIELFLQRPDIDVDSHWEGEARKMLCQDFPDIQLPAACPESQRIGTDTWMLDKLRSGDEASFVRGCEARQKDGTFDEFVQTYAGKPLESGQNAMKLAIENGMPGAVQRFLAAGATVQHSDIDFDTIRSASVFGQHQIVEQCLAKCSPPTPQLFASVSSAIAATIPQMGKSIARHRIETTDYRKCMDVLLNVKGIDLNRQDGVGNTALHLAVQYKQRDLAAQLLRLGASMGVRNVLDTVAIADIDADVLEAHLGECIGESEDRRPGDEKYELILRYGNFELAQRKDHKAGAGSGAEKSRDSGDGGGGDSRKAKYNKGEMTTIAHIAAAPDLRHLIKHPVIASFLLLKWNRLAPLFYANFIVYSVFCASLLLFIMSINEYPVIGTAWIEPIVIFGVIYMVFRETISAIIAPTHYVRDLTNYMSVVLIGLTITLLIGDQTDVGRRKVSAFAILLAVSEFFVSFGSMPVMSISTHWVMLLTVTQSFLKSLVLYSIILGAFALSLFTLFNSDQTGGPAIATSDNADETDFNKFRSPIKSFVKTFVMMMGEIEASDMTLNDNVATYIVLMLFLLIVSTVMFNLLTGMAICDMQEIQSDAELTYWIHRVKTLIKCEQIFGEFNYGCCNILMKSFTYNIDMFHEHLPCAAIKVLPNDKNRVKIPTSNAGFELGDDDTIELQIISGRWIQMICGFCLRYASSMEENIVRGARALIESRKMDGAKAEADELREANSERRLEKIEHRIETIIGAVQNHDAEAVRRMVHMEENINSIVVADLAMTVLLFAKSVAETPYKQELARQHVDQSFYMAGDTLETANAIIETYPMLRLLLDAYASIGNNSGADLLSNIAVRRAAGPLSNMRKIELKLSKREYDLYTSDDP